MSDNDIIIALGSDEPDDIEQMGSRDLVPKGYFKAFAKKVGYQVSSKKGTPSIHIEWVVQEPEEFKGRYIFDDLWLTNLDNPDKKFNLNRIKTILKACGKPYTGGKVGMETVIKAIKDAGYLILKVDIEHDKTGEYDSKSRVRGYRALDNAPAEGLGPDPNQPPMPNADPTPTPPVGEPTLDADIEIKDDEEFFVD